MAMQDITSSASQIPLSQSTIIPRDINTSSFQLSDRVKVLNDDIELQNENEMMDVQLDDGTIDRTRNPSSGSYAGKKRKKTAFCPIPKHDSQH
jgi:hypothetical protein